MQFSEITDRISNHLDKYRNGGYKVQMLSDEGGYEVTIENNGKTAVIRDGYHNGVSTHQKPPTITSFDVLFKVDGLTFLNYVSDYPLSEYGERLEEVFQLVDQFYEGNYTITEEKHFFRYKKYMNIDASGEMLHLLAVHRAS